MGGTSPGISEASIALCFEWAGCLLLRDVLLPFCNIVARTERRVQRTFLFRPYFLRTKLKQGKCNGTPTMHTMTKYQVGVPKCNACVTKYNSYMSYTS